MARKQYQGTAVKRLDQWKFDLVLNLRPSLNASRRRRGERAEQLVQEIVQTYLSHDQWFRAEVHKGLEQLETVNFDHDEVVARIERMFHP